MHEHLHSSFNDRFSYSGQVKRTLWIVLSLNWLVAIMKLVIGYVLNSASMIADGYHSFADGASNIVGLLGMRIAAQPKDKDHPYGHKKYETLASMGIAFLLFLVCFHLLHAGWERLASRTYPHADLRGFLVLGVTVVINAGVMLYEYRIGRRIGSDILVSDSLHTRADLLTSCSVAVAFVAIRLGFPMVDAVVAIVISGFIAYSGYEILRRSSAVLCDTAAIDVPAVESLVYSFPEVKKCHNIRTRGRSDDIYMDLHVLVDDRMPLVKAHDLTTKIEDAIKTRFEGVSDVVVHVEPVSREDHHCE